MKKTTRELLIVLGLLGVLLALLLPRLLPPPLAGLRQTSKPGSSTSVVTPSTPSAGLPPTAVVAVRPSYTAEAAARRDPMVSLLPDQTQASELATEGQTPPARALRAGGSDTAWRDDRQPAPTPASVGGALSVEGMVWGAARAQALINGTLYEVGDAVEGARIVSIEREGVTVERDGVQALVTPPPASVSTANQRAMGPGTRWYAQPQGR